MARILIVDDSKMMRRNLSKILMDAGHEVVAQAEDGSQACSAFAEHQPDLVTMDINMPIMDGIQAVKRIIVDFPDAEIVMISAHNEQSQVYEAIKFGAKNYIVKPIKAQTVVSVVNKILAKESASVHNGSE
ncbi:MAG: response regulator [candidate division Zixibacteria bacterium]|nr:response regulator [candidate division Zixibacteria bacterium]